MQLPAVVARRRDCASTATAAPSADGRPTISLLCAIGPPMAEGPLPMRMGEPMTTITPPWHTRAIVRTPLLPATVHNDAPTITAIAAQTPDERSKSRGMASGGTTQGVHMRPRAPPVPFLSRIERTIGAVSQGATGRVLRRVRKPATTRAVPNHEATRRRIRTLRRHVHEPRPGTTIAYPSALIAVADPLPCTSS